ncbi:MAG: hypothetical protein MUE33_04675 [Cytophagaceae bacterium]|jgi:hypothetical protein|nr:hypothetical protein [Cytophagaceae bacterium]
MKGLVTVVSTTLFVLCSWLVTAGVHGTQVPDTLRKILQTQYPSAEMVRWKVLEVDKYEVDFVWGEHEYIAYYRKDGSWIGTNRHVDESELPEIVQVLITKVAPQSIGHFCIESATVTDGAQYLVYYKEAGKSYKLIVNAEKYTYEVKPQ